jgi:hypothetical protein
LRKRILKVYDKTEEFQQNLKKKGSFKKLRRLLGRCLLLVMGESRCSVAVAKKESQIGKKYTSGVIIVINFTSSLKM